MKINLLLFSVKRESAIATSDGSTTTGPPARPQGKVIPLFKKEKSVSTPARIIAMYPL